MSSAQDPPTLHNRASDTRGTPHPNLPDKLSNGDFLLSSHLGHDSPPLVLPSFIAAIPYLDLGDVAR